MVNFPDFSDISNWELIEYWQVLNLISTTITAGVFLYNLYANSWEKVGGLMSEVLDNNPIFAVLYLVFWFAMSFTSDLDFVSSNAIVHIINGLYLIYNLALAIVGGLIVTFVLANYGGSSWNLDEAEPIIFIYISNWLFDVYTAYLYFKASHAYDTKHFNKQQEITA